MIQSHVVALCAFSALVSAVFATLARNDVPSRIKFGLKTFAAFVLCALAAGWLMRPFRG